MKFFLRRLTVNCMAILILTKGYAGLKIIGGLKTVLLAGLVITLINLIIRPLLKLIFLPINLLTLGLFRWIINVVCLFLLTTFVSSVKLSGFQFAGFSGWGIVIPSMEVSFFISLVICSFLLSFSVSFFKWLFY